MSPEEFFRIQNQTIQSESEKEEKVAVKPKRQKVVKMDSVDEAIAKIAQKVNYSNEQKIGLLANGMFFSLTMIELLIVGLMVLVGVLYPYPLNGVIIVMAIGIAIFVFYNMRRFRS